MVAKVFKGLALCLVAVLTGCGAADSNFKSWNHYGPAEIGPEETPLALSALDESSAGPLVVEGVIEEVCSIKGCWMVISDGQRTARVKFKGYSFLVPRNAAGRRVVIKGTGEMTLLDVAWARRLAERAGGSRAEIEAITRPVPVYEIQATAVYIKGSGLDEPHSES